jgi:hypothetical protein
VFDMRPNSTIFNQLCHPRPGNLATWIKSPSRKLVQALIALPITPCAGYAAGIGRGVTRASRGPIEGRTPIERKADETDK